MLTTTETIKLYLTLNKLMYKHSLLGKEIYNKQRNPDVDNPDFIKLLEISIFIDMLIEYNDSVILEGVAYPYYGIFEGLELDKVLDYLVYTYNLNPVPYLDFPKNTTTFIESTISLPIGNGNNGTELPNGGGVNFYLTKNITGSLIWDQIENVNQVKTKLAWSTSNPILKLGEAGYEVETNAGIVVYTRTKVGNGILAWNSLPYADEDIYPFAQTATINSGAIQAGDSLLGRKVIDIIQDMLSPYQIPAFNSFTANGQSNYTFEVGTSLASVYNLAWSLSQLDNVQNTNSGIISINKNNVFTSLPNVNLKTLSTNINSVSGFKYNLPDSFRLSITGQDIFGSNIGSRNIDFTWLGRVRFGISASPSVNTQSQINALSANFLSNKAGLARVYNFNPGYIYIAIPAFIDISNIKFIDVDNGLNFSMATQNIWDNSLPQLVSYNNGNTTYNYRIYRGEFFYNAPTSVRIEF